MIKNIAYYPSQCAQNAPPVMQAFVHGCQRNGIAVHENSMTADAAVIWSVLWNGRMKANQVVYEHYRSQGKPVICIDIGALHRGRTWKIAINNINAQGYYGHIENLDADRPAKLGINLSIPQSLRPAILIAAQHPRSLQVQHVDQVQWFAGILSQLPNDLPVVLRPHPRGKIDLGQLKGKVTVQQCHPVTNTYDNFDIDYNYHTVINYNSGAGIQAALAGTNIIVDSTSLAYPLSKGADRQQWLIEICHTEYVVDEIAQALWLKRIGHKLV